MTHTEAMELSDRINRNNTGTSNNLDPCKAEVVRILPDHVDPPKDGDNGWDVEVTVL